MRRRFNWVINNVYFQSNVSASGLSDGKLHHTSWVNATDGILAFDRNGNGRIDDITETVSAFLQAGPTPGKHADGLAALAQPGATSFSATTALTNHATGRSRADVPNAA